MRTGRVYDEPDASCRVLVDRLWPRGVRKDDPRIDRWLPAVAPSSELRRWYGHEAARFEEFARRYRAELETPEGSEALAELRKLAASTEITLVTATRELRFSHLAVLAEVL